jgi:lysophospholipase L1-like esterase
MIGINDLARGIPVGQVVRNVRMIVAQLQRECPGTPIYLQSLLPVNDDYGQFKAHTNKGDLIREVNAAFRQMAGGQVTFIDLYAAFSDVAGKLDRKYTNDGLHLNGTGYQRWAAIVAPYVD